VNTILISIIFLLLIQGYGRRVVRSDAGKITSIFCAVTTIPVTVATYYFSGRIVTYIVKTLILTFEKLVLKLRRVRQLQRKTLIIQLVMANVFLLVHSFAFYAFGVLERTSFVDCVYFTYTSILTIGFGDLVYNIHTFEKDDMKTVLPCLFIHIIFFVIEYSIVMSIITTLANLNNKYTSEDSITDTNSNQGDGTLINELILMETDGINRIGETNEVIDGDEDKHRGREETMGDSLMILLKRKSSKCLVEEDQSESKKLPDILQHNAAEQNKKSKNENNNAKSRRRPRVSKIYACDAKIAALQTLRRNIPHIVISTVQNP